MFYVITLLPGPKENVVRIMKGAAHCANCEQFLRPLVGRINTDRDAEVTAAGSKLNKNKSQRTKISYYA